MPKFYIDIQTSAGAKVGDGPIITAYQWTSSSKLDQAGEFSFTMPLADARGTLLASKGICQCYSMVAGTATLVGTGVIDSMVVNPIEHTLTVSGGDLGRELTYRQVGRLNIPGTTSGVELVMAKAPAGWAWGSVGASGTSYTTPVVTIGTVDHRFEGETVLDAMNTLVELTGEHFYLDMMTNGGRQLAWMGTAVYDSGVRAQQQEGESDTCLITSLEEESDSYDVITRIYPYGVGIGGAKKDLTTATWTPPAGYTMDTANNYIKYDYGEATDPGVQIDEYHNFPDLHKPNTLAQGAYDWLRTHNTVNKFYRLEIANLDKILRPGWTIRVIYRQIIDGYAAVDIDANLKILGVTTEIDERGLHTTALEVSTIDRYPISDAGIVLLGLNEAHQYGNVTDD